MKATKIQMAIAVLCLTTAALARADETHGLQIAARAGVTRPFGRILGGGGSNGFSDTFTAFVPFELEVGYRINPNVMIGSFFQIGPGLPKNCPASFSCSGHDLSFGVQGHYHFAPRQPVDPWVGLGVGFEILSASVSDGSARSSGDISVSGFQFVNLQGGVDFPLTPNLTLAPFVNLAVGTFTNLSVNGQSQGNFETALHELLTIGIRGAFNL